MGLDTKVGIVGGTRGMGAWFADFLEKQSIEVYRVGRKTALTPQMMARLCDVIVISVPIKDTIPMIEELSPLVSERSLMMDLTSIKKGPIDAMMSHSKSEVIGTHPLFGPEESGEGLNMIICPGRTKRWLGWLTKIIENGGIHIQTMTPEKHDQLMGLIQGVNHFSTLALALCIIESGFSPEEIIQCSTQTFKQRIDRLKSLLNQSSELFSSLLIDNSESYKYIDKYNQATQELATIVQKKDKTGFQKLFDELKIQEIFV